jgi:hypothetical protein
MDVPGSGEIQDTSTLLDFGRITEQRSAVFGIPLMSLAYQVCRGLPSSGCSSHFLVLDPKSRPSLPPAAGTTSCCRVQTVPLA